MPEDGWTDEFPPLDPPAGAPTLLPDPLDPPGWNGPITRPRPPVPERPPIPFPPDGLPLPPEERPLTWLERLARWWESLSLTWKVISVVIVVGIIVWAIVIWYRSETPGDEDLPPQVAPIAIRFNWDETSTLDALNIRRNATTEVELPEWTLGETDPDESPAAYAIDAVHDQVIRIKVQLMLIPPIDAVVNVRALGGGVLGEATRTEPVHFTQGWTFPEFIDFDLRNHHIGADGVRCEDIDWQWQFQLLGESAWHDIGTTSHRIYVVLATPPLAWLQSPFPHKRNPWTEVLDYSCAWAEGAKTAAEAAKLITHVVNRPVAGIKYDMENGGKGHFTDDASFRCTAFLDRLRRGPASSSPALVNCSDCAAIVSTFANVLGCNLDQSKMCDQSPNGDVFHLNKIIAIGYTDFGFPLWGDWFGYHEVAWQGGTASDPVWDACLQTNANGPNQPLVPVLPVESVFSNPYRRQLVRPSDIGRCQPDHETTWRREVD
ncbi:MAG: hypothetical protein ACRD3G_16780 [Vicinamibacterales bacterium]